MWGTIKKGTVRTALKRQLKYSSERIPNMETIVLECRWGRTVLWEDRNCSAPCREGKAGRIAWDFVVVVGGKRVLKASRNSRWQQVGPEYEQEQWQVPHGRFWENDTDT